MTLPSLMTLPEAFQDLPDPRTGNAIRHSFLEVILIALCATIAGADNAEEIARWAKVQEKWLKKFLTLPHGSPSADTFLRIFAALAPEAFNERFLLWAKGIFTTEAIVTPGGKEVIAIDGKTLKASANKGKELGALHLVSAWASHNRLVLAQTAVDQKENEISAIPLILEMLELKGCIVTIDAMGCQKQIAQQILAAEGHFFLQLKGNHDILLDRVKDFFDTERARGFTTSHGDAVAHSFAQTLDKGHGRLEIRRCWMVENAQYLDTADSEGHTFGFTSIVCLESERRQGDKVSVHTRYFLSDLPADAGVALGCIRRHWGIENRLHWVLDVCFDEDHCTIREENARENFAILRHIALNLLTREKSRKGGVVGRRKIAGWDVDYIPTVLAA